MESPDRVARVEQAMLDYCRFIGSAPSARLVEEPDCTWFTSGVPFAVYNGVIRCAFDSDAADSRIQELEQRFVKDSIPHHWFVPESAGPTDIKDRLRARGAVTFVTLNGMAMDLDSLKEVEMTKPAIDIRLVEDERAMRDYANLYPLLFSVPMEEWLDSLVALELELFASQDPRYHRFVAYDGSTPIAAGMTRGEGPSAALETLLTLPEYRGQGIGGALASKGLTLERDLGCAEAVVWAGPQADVLYARMGFEYVCTADVMGFPH